VAAVDARGADAACAPIERHMERDKAYCAGLGLDLVIAGLTRNPGICYGTSPTGARMPGQTRHDR